MHLIKGQTRGSLMINTDVKCIIGLSLNPCIQMTWSKGGEKLQDRLSYSTNIPTQHHIQYDKNPP